MKMRKTIVATSLIAGLVSWNPGLPAQAQWANRSDCNSLNFLYQEGYCIDHDYPMVATWSREGSFIMVTRTPTSGFVVTIKDYFDEQNRTTLNMWLDANRDIESIRQGSQAVAENHRRAISHALDIVEIWEPVSGGSF